MLRRAALPLLRPRHCRPAVNREAFPQLPIRSYTRNRGPADYKPPPPKSQSQDTETSQTKEPLRKVPFTSVNPAPRQEEPIEEVSFGSDPSKDLDDVSESVSQASKRDYRKQKGAPLKEQPIAPDELDQKSQQPLPDLTQGIPSTLDAELGQARAKHTANAHRSSLNITEDPAEELPSSDDRPGRGGEPPRLEYISSSDRKKSAVFRYMYLVLAAGATAYTVYLGRNWDTEEEEKAHTEAPSGWGFGAFYNRVQARLGSTVSYYRDPVTTKLLPDEDPDPNNRYPFTLVISLEDMLVHSEWTRDKGWRVAKRPGVDYFLRYLGAYYEIVLFTSQPMAMVDQLLRKLDPYSTIRWPLFREATLYKDGGYVKDLSYLNRDLKKVVVLDTDPHHVKHQPENAIILPKWNGDPKDQTLIQFIPFLEYLATMGFDDARVFVKSFEGTYIPAEFARREKLLREKFEAQQAEKRQKGSKSLKGIASFFGLSQPHPDGMQNADEAMAEGKMLWDQIRERGQQQYMEFERKIKTEGEKWLAERDAEEKRLQEEAMKNMAGGWFGGMFGGGAKPQVEEKKP